LNERREFIAGLVAAIATWRADAQEGAKVYRIAVVSPSSPLADMSETGSVRYGAFFKRLRQLGYIEGLRLTVARYSAEGQTEAYAELAHEVIRGKPDLIFRHRPAHCTRS
jgi:putative tryptophan/tyrosine transport system substrate-binding protein